MTRLLRAAAFALLGMSACSCHQSRGRTGWRSSVPSTEPAVAPAAARREQVVLAEHARAAVTIYAPARLAEADVLPATGTGKQRKLRRNHAQKLALAETRNLRAAVDDLAAYLGRMAGAPIPVLWGPPPKDHASGVPLLIAELGQERFGPPRQHAPGRQGFRVVIEPAALAAFGESDRATGYAIYELLDRLGCRWFMPGPLGEHIPKSERLALARSDDSLVPGTLFRDIWYADADFKRRNRLGGLRLNAAHMLERWISPAQRDEHPEWRATIKGVPQEERLRWSNPELAKAIAASIDAHLEKKPADSVSLSPGDGLDFDDDADRALDAGDWDPSANQVSVTDRLLVLTNRVAAELRPKYPELLLGLLAYASYTRPPVREHLQPNVVPVFAPITYCRVQPYADDDCPGAREARQSLQGWSARAEQLAFRGYAYNLAEPAAAFPLIRKWSQDLPFLFANKVRFFQPETLPNFETSLPGLYLGIRLSWDPKLTPRAVLNELFDDFYGHASAPTRAYWELMDGAWNNAKEYSGGGLGHARRFTPELLQHAREQLSAAAKSSQNELERERVHMLQQSQAQLELYMQMDRDFRAGKLAHLGSDLQRWQSEAQRLADAYEPNFAFAKTRWAAGSVYASYAKRFLQPIYTEAERIARESTLILGSPLCSARYRKAEGLDLPVVGDPTHLNETDPTTDFCSETWPRLGLYDYFGALWYELDVELPSQPPGKRVSLWLSKVDGAAQLWVNGTLLRAREAPAGAASAEGHLKYLTFDATAALRAGTNQLTVVVRRGRLAELGAGGLLGPILLYREK